MVKSQTERIAVAAAIRHGQFRQAAIDLNLTASTTRAGHTVTDDS